MQSVSGDTLDQWISEMLLSLTKPFCAVLCFQIWFLQSCPPYFDLIHLLKTLCLSCPSLDISVTARGQALKVTTVRRTFLNVLRVHASMEALAWRGSTSTNASVGLVYNLTWYKLWFVNEAKPPIYKHFHCTVDSFVMYPYEVLTINFTAHLQQEKNHKMCN